MALSNLKSWDSSTKTEKKQTSCGVEMQEKKNAACGADAEKIKPAACGAEAPSEQKSSDCSNDCTGYEK